MDEEEFQRLVEPLRQRHVACAEAAIGAPAGLTQVYAHLAREAGEAIEKVTQQYEFDKMEAAIERRLSSDAEKITTWSAPDGSGDVLMETFDGKRFRQSGDRLTQLPDRDAVPTISWIEHWDQLIDEWFDGEKKLIDAAYPESKKPRIAKKPKSTGYSPLKRTYISISLVWASLSVVQLMLGSIVSAMIWAGVALVMLVAAIVMG